MQDTTVSLLSAWENFYVIVGSAAAALTGLTFVVITLIAGSRRARGSGTLSAFSTPTVVHFCAALFIAALISAPWRTLSNIGLLILLGIAGLGGVGYAVIVLQRMRRQDRYALVMEDWLFHVIFPLVCYAALVISAIMLPAAPAAILFVVGASTIFLLFIGIHNSWDTVTYIVTERLDLEEGEQ